MAQRSRRERREKRTKRERSVLWRGLVNSQVVAQRHFAVLVAVLAQNGNVAVTKGTFDQVLNGLKTQTLGYRMVKGAVEGEYKVCLEDKAVKPAMPTPVGTQVPSVVDERMMP